MQKRNYCFIIAENLPVSTTMRINLNVPYSQKDRAKILGARWDKNKKTWYIENKENLVPFKSWLPFHIEEEVKQVLVKNLTHSTHTKITSV